MNNDAPAQASVEADDLAAWIESLPREPTPALRAAFEKYKEVIGFDAPPPTVGAEDEAVAWVTKWQFKAPDYPVKYPGGGSSITRDATEAAQELANKQRWDRVDWVRQTPLYAHPAPAAVESAQEVKEARERARNLLFVAGVRYDDPQFGAKLDAVAAALEDRASLATDKEG